MSNSEQGKESAVKHNEDANVYIDRAIEMLKDMYKYSSMIAGYNGVVSLLGYAKESHSRSISPPAIHPSGLQDESIIGTISDIDWDKLPDNEVLLIDNYTYIKKEKVIKMVENFSRIKKNEGFADGYAEAINELKSPTPTPQPLGIENDEQEDDIYDAVRHLRDRRQPVVGMSDKLYIDTFQPIFKQIKNNAVSIGKATELINELLNLPYQPLGIDVEELINEFYEAYRRFEKDPDEDETQYNRGVREGKSITYANVVSRMRNFFKAGYASSPQSSTSEEEKDFTLKEMRSLFNYLHGGCGCEICADKEREFFKEKFGIELK